MSSCRDQPPSSAERFTITFRDGRSCAVMVGPGSADLIGQLWQPVWREAALLGDARVMALYGAEVAGRLESICGRVITASFPPGEEHKTRATKALIEDQLLSAGLDRQSCIVALGGGISLDVAGFVAATYCRGVPYLNVPTSLLAQVDACLGGKTAVNTPHGKNLIGAFHQPSAVLIDGRYLGTLPEEEWGSGLAEMVKHAVIADLYFFRWLEDHRGELLRPGCLEPYPLRRCLEIKAAVVREDERESGKRSVLNFGHTVGHALEHALAHQLSHGRAVALGMRVEARVATELCGLSVAELERLERLLSGLRLLEPLPALGFDDLLPYLRLDKKRKDGALRLALPQRLGSMARGGEEHTLAVPPDVLRQAWERSR